MKNIVLKGAILLILLLVKHGILDYSQKWWPFTHKELFCSKGSFFHALVVAGPQLVIVPVFALVINCVSWWLFGITVASFVIELLSHMVIDFVKTNYRLTHEQNLARKSRRIALDIIDQLFHFLSLIVCDVLDMFLLDLTD